MYLWETPDWLFLPIDKAVGGFKLDVCGTPENKKAPKVWTEQQNGLVQPWDPGWNWCNPPYSDPLPWVERALSVNGHTCMLTNCDTSTAHFSLAHAQAHIIVFLTGRVRFEFQGKPAGSPRFPSCLVFTGPPVRMRRDPITLTMPTQFFKKCPAAATEALRAAIISTQPRE